MRQVKRGWIAQRARCTVGLLPCHVTVRTLQQTWQQCRCIVHVSRKHDWIANCRIQQASKQHPFQPVLAFLALASSASLPSPAAHLQAFEDTQAVDCSTASRLDCTRSISLASRSVQRAAAKWQCGWG